MQGPDVEGRTGDPLARAGEGTTVKLLDRRCTRCGARMEEICNVHTGELVAIRCRGGCKAPVQTFPIPPGAKAQPCRSCGTPVYWIRTLEAVCFVQGKAGKLMPVESDGVSHFARCKQASAWRKGRGNRWNTAGTKRA